MFVTEVLKASISLFSKQNKTLETGGQIHMWVTIYAFQLVSAIPNGSFNSRQGKKCSEFWCDYQSLHVNSMKEKWKHPFTLICFGSGFFWEREWNVVLRWNWSLLRQGNTAFKCKVHEKLHISTAMQHAGS